MNASIGKQLMDRRTALGHSLEQVSEAIRIKPAFLQALETDDLDALPSLTHARGYIRSYASYLNLDSQPLLDSLKPQAALDANLPTQVATPAPGEPVADQSSVDSVDEQFADPAEGAPAPEEPVQPAPGPIATAGVAAGKPSANIFQEIGGMLRTQRQALGLDLEEVEKFTHLRAFYLDAMEAGRFHQLPSAVQAKGMITNYARFLDLDTEAILLRYAEGVQAEFLEKQAVQAVEQKREKTVVRKAMPLKFIITPDLIIGFIAIFSLVAFLLWSTTQIITERRREMEDNLPGISGILLQSTVESETERMTQTAIAATNDLLNATETPAMITVTVPVSPTITLAPQLSGPVQINITAYGRVYLKVIADGKVAFLGRTAPGNAYPFSADNQIELITGDASMLQVVYNQTPIGTLGRNLEAAHLIFTAEDVVTPTPMFTLTPTQTIVPSRTPTLTPTLVAPTITPYVPSP